jgi:hypothetical protein
MRVFLCLYIPTTATRSTTTNKAHQKPRSRTDNHTTPPQAQPKPTRCTATTGTEEQHQNRHKGRPEARQRSPPEEQPEQAKQININIYYKSVIKSDTCKHYFTQVAKQKRTINHHQQHKKRIKKAGQIKKSIDLLIN